MPRAKGGALHWHIDMASSETGGPGRIVSAPTWPPWASDTISRSRMRSQSSLDVTVLVLLLAVPLPLFGQVPYDACRDRTGAVIEAQVAPDEVGRFAAMATWKEGQRVILWRPSAFNGLSDVARVFVYLHECAHHTLHHVDRI